jgi:hypothetical protein
MAEDYLESAGTTKPLQVLAMRSRDRPNKAQNYLRTAHASRTPSVFGLRVRSKTWYVTKWSSEEGATTEKIDLWEEIRYCKRCDSGLMHRQRCKRMRVRYERGEVAAVSVSRAEVGTWGDG